MVEPSTNVTALVDAFQRDGFVVLEDTAYHFTSDDVERVLHEVTTLYDRHLAHAQDRGIDLSKDANSEVINGFYVRKGGRIDMQLVNTAPSRGGRKSDGQINGIDGDRLHELAARWQSIVDSIFCPSSDGESGGDGTTQQANYALEYIGCVMARPGDADQNWHLDGIHRNMTKHEAADRINVFVPLVDISKAVGGTEMKKESHIHDEGRRGTAFSGYSHLESVTHYVTAGTPIVMDYRVWHRGLANNSSKVRPLLYFKYARNHTETDKSKRPLPSTTTTTRPKKRIALTST